MKNPRTILFSILTILIFQAALAQDIETKLRRLLEKNKAAELRDNIKLIKIKYPNNPTIHYIEACLEKDGEQAIKKYNNFIARFPRSQYVLNAKYKLAQYNFARGLYHTAKQLLEEIANSYQKSSVQDDAHYLLIRTLIALGNVADAKAMIKSFLKKFPQSQFKYLAQLDLKQLSDSNYSKSYDEKDTGYTIQIGAYSERANAVKQMEIISRWGYSVEIKNKFINNRLFYLVWVETFETEEQALNFGEIFKKKYGLPFRVVKKDGL